MAARRRYVVEHFKIQQKLPKLQNDFSNPSHAKFASSEGNP
jgi:hypothetical protein